ncbi:putative bifunctional inhibitor/plant lipid transfer protein/seed storage helical domain superfamily [Helianthus annuus]|nr:putative bifunctional inhibitor/plant lipid transfer protein/seed storage helical domain superfamily [Helianthus annuus]
MFYIQKSMHTVNLLKWAVLTFLPIVSAVPIPPFAPRPLCNFQLALANQACAYLPSLQIPPPPPSPFNQVFPTTPPPPERHEQIHSHGHKHDHSHGDAVGTVNGQNQSHVHKHGHGHGHHRHDHHKHRVRGHHHKHKMSPVEQQCCKWLAQVDDECVCELLGRLPPFLVRPIHEYTVRVAGSCNTTYSCGAQLRL